MSAAVVEQDQSSSAKVAQSIEVATLSLTDSLQRDLAQAGAQALAALGREALVARGSSPKARADDCRKFASPAVLEFAADVADQLHNGSGALRVTGFPIAEDADLTTMSLLVFSAGLGVSMPNNRDGVLAWPVVAEQQESSKDIAGNTRDGNTGSHLIFHTDTCSFAALFCVLPAEEGGSNLFVSTQMVYDRIQAERPDLLAQLFEPVFIDRKGEEQSGASPYATIPVLGRHNGNLQVHWTRTYTVSAYKRYPVPPLRPLQSEALRYLERTISIISAEVHFEGRADKGDLVLMNNNKVFHSRTPFRGGRRLLRLWIENAKYPALPHTFGYEMDSTRWPD